MRVGQQLGAVVLGVRRRSAPADRRRLPYRASTALIVLVGLLGSASVVPAHFLGLADTPAGSSLAESGNEVVFTEGAAVDSPFVPAEVSASFAQRLLPIDAGLVAVGRQGIGGATASIILVSEDGPATVGEVVLAERTIAAAGSQLVVVDTKRLRVLAIDDAGSLEEIGGYERTDDFEFGTVAAMNGQVLAVTRATPASNADDGQAPIVEVFDLTHGAIPVVAFAPELDRVQLAVSDTGDLVAVSGVRERADRGEVQFFRRVDSAWLVDERFDAVGGGAIEPGAAPDSFVVQDNGFFTRPTGPWTRIAPDAEGRLTPTLLPVQAASSAADGDLVAFGLPERELVMTFTLVDGALEHLQTITAPIPDPEDGEPARRRAPESGFGTSVAFASGRLVVGGPGAVIDGVADEGSLFVFTPVEGPRGCTITGTQGDDILNGTIGDDVICGLGGDDLIRGNKGFDRIYGGPGDDDLSGDAAADLLVGGDGADRLAGGAGRDALFGGEGNDQIFGGADGDRLIGGGGRDACFGGADRDTFETC